MAWNNIRLTAKRVESHDQKTPIPHALLVLADGSTLPGRFSEVNHCWLAWDGKEHVRVHPALYIDLLAACQRKESALAPEPKPQPRRRSRNPGLRISRL